MDELKNLYDFLMQWWKLAKKYIPQDMNSDQAMEEFISVVQKLYRAHEDDNEELNKLKYEMSCNLSDYVLKEPIKRALSETQKIASK